MRVAHLACVAPPELGGIGRVAAEEVRHLNEAGIEARLFAPAIRTRHDEPFIEGISPLWRLRNAGTLWPGAVLRWKPDVIHIHYPYYGTAELWLSLPFSIPIILTYHMDAAPEGWRKLVQRLHTRFLQPLVLRRAKALLVSSRDYMEHSALAPLMPMLGDRLKELPFAVETDKLVPVAHKHTAPKLLFVGAMDAAHAFKGVPELLEALSELTELPWTLELIGEGSLRADYMSFAEKMGLESRVQFLGRCSDERLREAYQQSDLLLFPSTSRAEAFGLVALEAQSCGVPVIASNLPGVRTVVRDQETGLLVPPGDVRALREAIRTLLTDSEKRTRFGIDARAHALSRYSWEVHTAELLSVYKQVCASRS